MDDLSLVDYSRQEEMDSELSTNPSDNVIIIGCGGVGAWLALLLAMHGQQNMVLVDGQDIEPSNLNRIPVPQTWVGKNKAIAVRKMIKFLRPDTNISVVPLHVLSEEGFKAITVLSREVGIHRAQRLFDCTDDARIQQKITVWCKEFDIQYTKVGYEGYKIGVYQGMDDVWTDDATYQPGYRTSRANAISSAIAGGLGILGQWLNIKDITVDIRKTLQGE